jgi:hypothetical protein
MTNEMGDWRGGRRSLTTDFTDYTDFLGVGFGRMTGLGECSVRGAPRCRKQRLAAYRAGFFNQKPFVRGCEAYPDSARATR